MLFEEYIKIFEEVLALTEKIEALCAKFKSDEADPLFHQRNELMKKLNVPEDIDDEKFAKLLAIKEKISKLNEKILAEMQKEKEKAKKETNAMKKNIPLQKSFSDIPELKLKNDYKKPKSNGSGGSIFS